MLCRLKWQKKWELTFRGISGVNSEREPCGYSKHLLDEQWAPFTGVASAFRTLNLYYLHSLHLYANIYNAHSTLKYLVQTLKAILDAKLGRVVTLISTHLPPPLEKKGPNSAEIKGKWGGQKNIRNVHRAGMYIVTSPLTCRVKRQSTANFPLQSWEALCEKVSNWPASQWLFSLLKKDTRDAFLSQIISVNKFKWPVQLRAEIGKSMLYLLMFFSWLFVVF